MKREKFLLAGWNYNDIGFHDYHSARRTRRRGRHRNASSVSPRASRESVTIVTDHRELQIRAGSSFPSLQRR